MEYISFFAAFCEKYTIDLFFKSMLIKILYLKGWNWWFIILNVANTAVAFAKINFRLFLFIFSFVAMDFYTV